MIRQIYFALAVVATFAASFSAASADPVADFYKGKKIRMVLPVPPGGTVSLYGTTIAQHMERHIPGQPNIIHEYRTGSGGVIAANYVFNAAPKDGTVFTTLLSTAIIYKQLRPKSARFIPADFNFIGRMTDNPRVLIAWHATGINSIEDTKKASIPLGSASKLSVTSIHPLLMNRLAGTKFQIVNGYRGAGPSYLALERGEIAATTVAWDGLVGNRSDWLRDGKVKVLLRMGSRALPGYESVPELREFGTTPEDKAVLTLMSLPADTGQVLAAPPGIPADRLAALRKAFEATMRDPTFLAEAKKRKMTLRPMWHGDVQKLFDDARRMPQSVTDRTLALIKFKKGEAQKCKINCKKKKMKN